LVILNGTFIKYFARIKWIPFHHGMARPQAADRKEGLQIWRVAENVLKSKHGKPTRSN
jgi:hypothetical protein